MLYMFYEVGIDVCGGFLGRAPRRVWTSPKSSLSISVHFAHIASVMVFCLSRVSLNRYRSYVICEEEQRARLPKPKSKSPKGIRRIFMHAAHLILHGKHERCGM